MTRTTENHFVDDAETQQRQELRADGDDEMDDDDEQQSPVRVVGGQAYSLSEQWRSNAAAAEAEADGYLPYDEQQLRLQREAYEHQQQQQRLAYEQQQQQRVAYDQQQQQQWPYDGELAFEAAVEERCVQSAWKEKELGKRGCLNAINRTSGEIRSSFDQCAGNVEQLHGEVQSLPVGCDEWEFGCKVGEQVMKLMAADDRQITLETRAANRRRRHKTKRFLGLARAALLALDKADDARALHNAAHERMNQLRRDDTQSVRGA